ncbi:MAG TPA: hypothetical protein VIU61_14015, partial [Kofleriaceae bacterium]
MHLFWLASIAGALLFFAAGAAMVALRRRPAVVVAPARQTHEEPRDDQEIATLRARLAHAEAAARDVEALRTRA